MRIRAITLLCVSLLTTCAVGMAGFVTPAQISVKLNGIYFMDLNNYALSALATPGTLTFKASDPDFQMSAVSSVVVPEGRFIGIGLDLDTTRSIVLDGTYVYTGEDGSLLDGGQYPCSTGTATDGTGITAGSNPLSCPTPATLTVKPTGTQYPNVVSFTYFANIVCVTTPDRKSSICKAGDTFVDAGLSSDIQVSILIDILDAIAIDPNVPQITAFPTLPFAVFGPPGASVHLQGTSPYNWDGSPAGTNPNQVSVADVTVLLDNQKNVVYANAQYSSNTGGPVSGGAGLNFRGYCAGQPYQKVTAIPTETSSALTLSVAKFDPITGFLAFAATFLPGSQIDAQGIDVFNSLYAGGANWASGGPPTVKMICYPDSDSINLPKWDTAFQAYLGYTYTGGSGNTPLVPIPVDINLVKVVDPGNLLGWSGSACNAGVCGGYPQ